MRFVNYYLVRKLINAIRNEKLKKLHYYIKNEDRKIFDNSVVYCANGFLPHGGLADRIYGLLTTYAICKIKNWNFSIFFNSPYNLEDFFSENTYKWKIPAENISYNLSFSKPILRMGGCPVVDFNNIRLNNKQIHLYSNYKWLDNINKKYGTQFTWKGLFNELFVLSEKFASDLQRVKEKLPKEFVSLQIRVQNALGDFPDCNSEELIDKEKESLYELCKTRLIELYGSRKLPILVTSDSNNLIKKLSLDSQLDFLCFIPGEISHSDNKKNLGYDNNVKTFIDLFCISAGKEIYQLKSKYIYKSGFSVLAAELSDKKVIYI